MLVELRETSVCIAGHRHPLLSSFQLCIINKRGEERRREEKRREKREEIESKKKKERRGEKERQKKAQGKVWNLSRRISRHSLYSKIKMDQEKVERTKRKGNQNKSEKIKERGGTYSDNQQRNPQRPLRQP